MHRLSHRCRAPSTDDAIDSSSPAALSQSPLAPPSCPASQSKQPARPAPCRRADPSGSDRSTTWHSGARSAPRCDRCPAANRPMPPGMLWPLSSDRTGTQCAPEYCVATAWLGVPKRREGKLIIILFNKYLYLLYIYYIYYIYYYIIYYYLYCIVMKSSSSNMSYETYETFEYRTYIRTSYLYSIYLMNEYIYITNKIIVYLV